jgi:hypothetical protein
MNTTFTAADAERFVGGAADMLHRGEIESAAVLSSLAATITTLLRIAHEREIAEFMKEGDRAFDALSRAAGYEPPIQREDVL